MDVVTYSLLNKKIKGLTSGVKSASVQGTSIIFIMNDGSKQTITFPTPADGISITDVSIDTDRHLICTMSDGTVLDAGEIPTIKGDKGFSPTIMENPDNTKEIYKLDVTNEDGTFTTPNLKGTGGGLDPDKYYDKTQIDSLIEPLDEAKHTHDNKDTVLDKLDVSTDGSLLFDGNEIKGSVEIDDTSTSATDKTWSAKKINDTADEIKQSVADINNKFADYDTSAEVDTKITTALTDYEKSADVDTKISTALQDYDKSDIVDGKITVALTDYEKSADVDIKLGDYYKKTETYSNTEIDGKFTDFETNLTADIKAWVDSEESLGIKTALYQNNTLTFYKKPNATADDTADFTIDLPVEQFLDQTKTTFVNQFAWSEELYPNSTDPNLDGAPVLVLAVKGDTTVSYSFVSMNELVKIYKADMNTSTVTLVIDDATNTISASVNISADTGNLLKVGTDGGLYAKATDISGKADKLTDTDIKENQILVDDGNGNIGASGKSISEYIPAWSGTKAEWETFDKSTLADGAIINITDDYNENPVQVKAMPDTATEGDVLQYIGQSTSDYTNGYFYKYVTDETGILSWKNIPVMQAAKIDDNTTGADSTWSSTKLTTELGKNVAKEQGVSNTNKRLVVGTDGNLGLTTLDGYVTDAIVVTDEFDSDILKWDTGTYKISHRTDLVNLPFDVDSNNLCFRLEHHNLKKWEGNHNPNTNTYGVRYSVLYCQNGATYTREYESGATAGTYTKDTGWRKSTQDKYSLVTNSQTFKFTIKKNRFSWFGFAKFEYSQGASKAILSEIDIAITTAAISYTVAKGNDIIESMTYTFDADNNPTIGIKLKEEVFGTQSLTVPSEFGTITEFSGEEFTGSTALIKMTSDTPVLTNYSSEEKEIGTWVDGKKLYRKCYSATSISDTTGSITLDNGLSGITPIKIGGAFDITSNVYPLPYGIAGNADGYCVPVYQNMNGSFVLRYSKDVFGTIFKGYNVFIEYTKN